MNKNQLKDELARVHDKLNNLDSVSEDEKLILKKITDDINALIDRSEEGNYEEDKNFIDELKESIRRSGSKFEVQNPELAESINIIMQTLSNLGI